LNVAAGVCDQATDAAATAAFVCVLGADNAMETIRPEGTDPIPLRQSPQRMGVIMIRFVGLLFVAVAVLTLLWNR
jgi:hypothetical protein